MFWFRLKVFFFYFWGQAEQPKRFMSQRNLLNGWLQNIDTSYFFLRPETYMSLMLLVIFPIVKLPWLCIDDRVSNFLHCPFPYTNIEKYQLMIGIVFHVLMLKRNFVQCEILNHVKLHSQPTLTVNF